jgi:hypothetical protein
MAGIEKVCEVCEEYCSWEMYSYKHNRIQVCPSCRKKFSSVGEEHTLHFMKPQLYEEYRFGGVSRFDEEKLSWWEPPYKNKEEYLEDKPYLKRFLYEYDYVLHVPSVPGTVQGFYQHTTRERGKLFRKLKRLLKTNKLNVVYHDIELTEWYQTYDK